MWLLLALTTAVFWAIGNVLIKKGVGQMPKNLIYFSNAAILVAPFDGFIGAEQYDTLNKTFVDHPFDWKKIKQNCQKFVVTAGDDDPYVPIKFPQRMVDNLGVKLQIIKGGKHLGETIKEFPAVLEEIRKLA